MIASKLLCFEGITIFSMDNSCLLVRKKKLTNDLAAHYSEDVSKNGVVRISSRFPDVAGVTPTTIPINASDNPPRSWKIEVRGFSGGFTTIVAKAYAYNDSTT